MIEDQFLDKLGGNINNTHLIDKTKTTEIKNEHNLVDIWRKNNPFKRLFTYHNHVNTTHSRLDRIYLSKTNNTKTCKIMPNSFSDHDAVPVLTQISKENPRGPGTWKLNTSILNLKQFRKTFQQFWTFWQNKKTEYKNHN